MSKPAEHATVVVGIVALVDSLHLLVHADLECFELPQQLYRDDKLAERILLTSEVSKVVGLRLCGHAETLISFLNLDPMLNFGGT